MRDLNYNNTNNIKSIQIIRAIASTSVVYYHIGSIPIFGSFGLDIFFVISGFVMAMVIEDGQGSKIFAINRISRIIPLYWILTTCLLIVSYVKPEILNSTTANIENYVKSILFIPYFKENGALHPMLAVGWTLNYEMFFYFCIWLATILERKIYIQITVALLVASFLLLGNLSTNTVIHGFFGNSIVFEFVFGIVTFKIYKARLIKNMGKISLLITAIISYIAMVLVEINEFQITRVFIYGIPSFIFVLSVIELEKSNFVTNSYFSNVLADIGDASYATYLSHLFIVEGTRKILFQKLNLINPYTPLGVVFIILTSLAIGQILYAILDKPLSKYLKRKLQAAF